MTTVGFVCSRVRKDEKLLLGELREREGVDVERIDPREVSFGLDEMSGVDVDADELDVVVDRAMSYSRGLYAVRFFESYGVPVVNASDVARTCGDKVETTVALRENGVPTPETRVAFTPESALETVESMGYPVVVKPVVGSWARLLAKVNDRDSAEAVFEHKKVLGSYEHSVFYVQNFVEKPGRDIRVAVIGGEAVAAMYRKSDDWITNAARGAETTDCEVTDEIENVALDAAEAVGCGEEGVVGVDIMEDGGDLTVHEVNHSLEFKALTEASGVNVAGAYADHVVEVAETR
ncbi:MAG: lysine biosynthesis protein LysX [Halobacteriales archaeon]|nr:lysine biosynthesis protein LysX [Halobacteriales archaeon]